MKLPDEDKLVALIDAAHAGPSEFRPHLGASIIGHPCDRWLWLSFRFAVRQHFDGRIKRLFRRGQNEEATVVSDLRDAGLSVSECLNQQKHHSLAPHIGCTPDGLVVGHPEAPKAKTSLEIKTHSLKSFTDLEKNGVEKSQPKHYAQMQCEMKAQRTERALYVAICKDDDRIYTERVRYVKETADSYIDRGKRIVFADRMPEPMAGASASWFECKFCPGYDMCHGSKTTKEVNCRTCTFSTAMQDGTWKCERFDCEIPFENQVEGCSAHVLHMDLVPWQLDTDASTEDCAVWIIGDKRIANGEADANVYGSTELVANLQACLNPDAITQEMREEFNARIVG